MRCLQSVEAVMRGRDFKLAILKGEFGNFCVVLGAWGALFGAVAVTNYFGHGVVRVISESETSPQSHEFNDANQEIWSKDIVYQKLLRDQPDLSKALRAHRDAIADPLGPVFHYARGNAFEKIIAGDYQGAEEMFKLAGRPRLCRMCGDPNGPRQVESDLDLLHTIMMSVLDPGCVKSQLDYEPDCSARADISERADEQGIFITYLKQAIAEQKKNKYDADRQKLTKAWASALTGELTPAERTEADTICDSEIQKKTSDDLIFIARYFAATGRNDKAEATFKKALADGNYWEFPWYDRKVFPLYQHYINTGHWYRAYDFALEGSRLTGNKKIPYLACLVDFYLRLKQRPKWRDKILRENPALAVEFKNSSWESGIYPDGREALLRDLEIWTTEKRLPSGKGPIFLCAPLLQNLICWCKLENLNEKIVPLLNLNLGLAKKYGTTGDVVNALSLLADYYNSKGDKARADKYYAALVKAATSADGRVIGLGGGLWINDLSVDQLSKAWTTPAEKIAIISALKRSRDNVVQEFGANSLQEMMQIRNAAHFLLACGDSGEATQLSSAAWAMALKGKFFPIEERRRVLVDYIAGLKATKNEKVAQKLAPLLGAISDPDSE